MGKEISAFGDIEIEKNKFYRRKTPVFFLKDVNIQKVLVFNKISSGEKNYKCSNCHLNNDHKPKPLHIMLIKPSAYVKSYDGQTK